MSNAWNFERRRIVCGKFLVGVSVIAKGIADVGTSLEAVRSRMRLPPEDALFAARRLSEEQLIEFEPGGAVRSKSNGIERANNIVRSAIAKTHDFDEVARTLSGGGLPLELLKIALMANGGVLDCGAPENDRESAYRIALTGDDVTIERSNSKL